MPVWSVISQRVSGKAEPLLQELLHKLDLSDLA